VDEQVASFGKQEERHSHLEKPDMRVCDLVVEFGKQDELAWGGAGCTTGDRSRAVGPMELCRPTLGLCAGKDRQDIFLDGIAVIGDGADR
jgi:hypothetical protein